MAWTWLIIAGLLEVVWAYFMKQSHGFSRFWPSVIALGTMGISFALLSLSMRTLPLGTAYTVWTGIGAVGAFIVGVLWLNEGVNPMRVTAAGLILTGIVVMRLAPS